MRRLVVVGPALCLALASALGAQTTVRVVAFGDSLTFGEGDDPGRGGYPSRLATLLTTPERTYVIENEGVGGETTAEGLSRIGNLDGVASDSLILMEGTNDTFQNVSDETITANLVAMVNKAKQGGFGTVYLATVVPLGTTSSGNKRRESITLSDEIRQTAYEENLPMPDPHQGIYDLPTPFANLYTNDGIHLNAAGYDALAEIFADYIEGIDSIAPAPSFVFPVNETSNVPADTLLQVVLFDPLTGVDQATATLTLDGVVIDTTVTGDPRRTLLRAQPGTISGQHLLGVDVRDRAEPVNHRVLAVSDFTAIGSSLLTGDIDRSGRVDGGDLVLLAFSFGAANGTSRYRDAADLDDDGVVDGTDLAQLAANFGRSSG